MGPAWGGAAWYEEHRRVLILVYSIVFNPPDGGSTAHELKSCVRWVWCATYYIYRTTKCRRALPLSCRGDRKTMSVTRTASLSFSSSSSLLLGSSSKQYLASTPHSIRQPHSAYRRRIHVVMASLSEPLAVCVKAAATSPEKLGDCMFFSFTCPSWVGTDSDKNQGRIN